MTARALVDADSPGRLPARHFFVVVYLMNVNVYLVNVNVYLMNVNAYRRRTG